MTSLRQNQFTVGDAFLRGEESFHVDAIQLSTNHMTLIGTSGEVVDLSIQNFRTSLEKGVFERPKSPTALPDCSENDPSFGWDEKRYDELLFRSALVRTVDHFRNRNYTWKTILLTLKEDGLEVEGERQECTLSERRIKQLYSDWRKFGESALRSFIHRRGNYRPRYDAEFERIADTVIDGLYVKSENICIAHAAAYAEALYRKECEANGATTSACGRKAFESVLSQRSDFEVLAKRLDPKNARQLKRFALRQFTDLNPLDRVELDCTPTDLFIVGEDGTVNGRATVCAVIDVATSAILAANVTMAGPNQYLVLKTLKDAMSSRDEAFFERHDIKFRFNPSGMVAYVDCDRGAENRAGLVSNFLLQLGLLDPVNKPGKPEKRPHIERFWRELNAYLRGMPGGVNERLAKHAGHTGRAMARAGMMFHDVETLIHVWINDVYHQTPLERLSKRFGEPTTPAQAWEKLRHTIDLNCSPNEAELRAASLLYKGERTVQHYGVDVEGEKYHCTELAKFSRDQPGPLKVDVFIDCTDMRTVEVFSKDRGFRCTAMCRWDMPAFDRGELKSFQKGTKPEHTDRDKVRLAQFRLVTSANATAEKNKRTHAKKRAAAGREKANVTILRSREPSVIHSPQLEFPVQGPGIITRPGENDE